MGKTGMTITGLKEFEEKLKQLEPKVAKKVIRSVLKPVAQVAKAAIEQEAPVGETGLLSQSVKIKTRTRKGKMTATVQIGAKDFAGDTFYAAMREFGTSKMAPDPFTQRAFDKTKAQNASDMQNNLADAVNDALKK